MSSEGNSEFWRPSGPSCWFVQLLVPESRMFSDPDTVRAGPPGPRKLWIFFGSGEGNFSESPCEVP
jgi:hypothetical protein